MSSPADSVAVMSLGRMVGGPHLSHLLQPGVGIGPGQKPKFEARFLSLPESTGADRQLRLICRGAALGPGTGGTRGTTQDSKRQQT
jgi:hypothetical protein